MVITMNGEQTKSDQRMVSPIRDLPEYVALISDFVRDLKKNPDLNVKKWLQKRDQKPKNEEGCEHE